MLPEVRVQVRELFDDRIDHRDDVVVIGSGKPATGGLEIFEEHHVAAVVVEGGVQHAGTRIGTSAATSR